VLDVWIKVEEKSASAVMDALRRLNIFLGMWVLSGGCYACGWFSAVIHGLVSPGAGFSDRDIKSLDPSFDVVLKLPDPVRQKVCAALYWVRAPKNASMEYYIYENDLLRIYSGYWNAFECLVDAVNMIVPQPSFPRLEKQKKIDEFIEKQIANHGKITAEDIHNCYSKIVNPGFKGKAINALTVCFLDPAPLIKECFEMPEKRDNLYQVRNVIDHGDIDAENPDELLRVEWRFPKLYRIVLGMITWIIDQNKK
jgi:hypothetical protein